MPTLFYQNPRATAAPVSQRKDYAADDAFYVSEFINADLKDVDFRFKPTSQTTVFDSYVLGYGVVKIGYATEFGPDILPTKGSLTAPCHACAANESPVRSISPCSGVRCSYQGG